MHCRSECAWACSHVHVLIATTRTGWCNLVFFFFPPHNDSLVLYRCSLSCTINLCPSLPLFFQSSLPFICPLPRSLFGQFNQGATRMWASLLFHHGVTLFGEKYSLMGFLLLPFLLVSPLLLPPTLSCLIVPRFLILPSFCGDFPLCSRSTFF